MATLTIIRPINVCGMRCLKCRSWGPLNEAWCEGTGPNTGCDPNLYSKNSLWMVPLTPLVKISLHAVKKYLWPDRQCLPLIRFECKREMRWTLRARRFHRKVNGFRCVMNELTIQATDSSEEQPSFTLFALRSFVIIYQCQTWEWQIFYLPSAPEVWDACVQNTLINKASTKEQEWHVM